MNSKEIGLRIKQIRMERGFTQLEVANAVKLNPVSIARIEAGTQRAPLDTLEKILGVCGYSVSVEFAPSGCLDNPNHSTTDSITNVACISSPVEGMEAG